MKTLFIVLLSFVMILPSVHAKSGSKREKVVSEKSSEGCSKKCDKKSGCKDKSSKNTLSISTFQDSLSYAYGMAMGKQTVNMFKQMKDDLNYDLSSDIIIAAFRTQIDMDSTSVLLTEEQLGSIYNQTNNLVRKVSEEKRSKALEETKKAGKEFLDKKASEEGVNKTESGLLYKVDVLGTGEKPLPTSVVKVNYAGRLIDGKEFDSSYKRNEPIEFALDGVIKGWQEGLQLMPVGSKYTFYIPSELAYGDNGQGPIPAASVLIFDVELLDIIPNK